MIQAQRLLILILLSCVINYHILATLSVFVYNLHTYKYLCMATHESINRARDDDDYTVHEASRYVCQEDHRGGY